jgi:hypothetical protein
MEVYLPGSWWYATLWLVNKVTQYIILYYSYSVLWKVLWPYLKVCVIINVLKTSYCSFSYYATVYVLTMAVGNGIIFLSKTLISTKWSVSLYIIHSSNFCLGWNFGSKGGYKFYLLCLTKYAFLPQEGDSTVYETLPEIKLRSCVMSEKIWLFY